MPCEHAHLRDRNLVVNCYEFTNTLVCRVLLGSLAYGNGIDVFLCLSEHFLFFCMRDSMHTDEHILLRVLHHRAQALSPLPSRADGCHSVRADTRQYRRWQCINPTILSSMCAGTVS